MPHENLRVAALFFELTIIFRLYIATIGTHIKLKLQMIGNIPITIGTTMDLLGTYTVPLLSTREVPLQQY
jgi:hypothetical protein